MPSFVEQLQARFANAELTRDDLHDYQDGPDPNASTVAFLKANPFSALFVDLGFGKTVSVLTLIADLLDGMEFERCLVVGPLRVVNTTWPDEIPKWRHTAHLTYAHIRDEELQEAVRRAGQVARAPIVAIAKEEAIRRGLEPLELNPISTREVVNEFVKVHRIEIDKARRRTARKEIREASLRTPATIHLINREQVEFLVAAWGKDWPYDVVIIDESSSLKDHKTKRFKALRRVRPLIKRLHQLTATPAAEGYMGLFAQVYLLDGGERLGTSITAYRDRYFVRGYDGYSWKLRPGAEEEIAAKIADICLTLKKDEKDNPPISNIRSVKLSREELALYKALERDYVMELPDGTEIEAETAASLSSKLLQMASGCVYDDKKQTHFIHNHKIDELQQIVEEACGEPLLVAYWYKSSLARLREAFPKAVVMDPAGKAVAPWNKRKIDMMLIHPQGAGHGLNLQHGGHHLVFFDIPWSLELYLQTVGRLDRQGQKNRVVLHHLVADETVEKNVVKALREKRNAQDELFRLLKRLRGKGLR
jgi:hypothetical protein